MIAVFCNSTSQKIFSLALINRKSDSEENFGQIMDYIKKIEKVKNLQKNNKRLEENNENLERKMNNLEKNNRNLN